MDRPEHYVRPDDEPMPPILSWWRRTYGHIYHFMFQKTPGYEPPYHANGNAATINDPRYPRMFLQAREEFPSTKVDRVAPDDDEGDHRE
jgi:hypothetical protein